MVTSSLLFAVVTALAAPPTLLPLAGEPRETVGVHAGSEFRATRAAGVWLVREPASASRTIVRKLGYGAAVELLGEQRGVWSRVRTVGGREIEGWIMTRFAVDPSDVPPRRVRRAVASPKAPEPIDEPESPDTVEVAQVAQPTAEEPETAETAETAGSLPPEPAPPRSEAEQDLPVAAIPAAATQTTPLSTAPASTIPTRWLQLLLLLLGVAFLVAYRRRGRRAPSPAGDEEPTLEALRTVNLGRGVKLALLRAPGRLLVVSCSPEGLALVADAPDQEGVDLEALLANALR